jgi:hypothetical protein
MGKEDLLQKAKETLSPFETQHVVAYIKSMTVKSVMENPWLITVFLIIFFFAVVKRSKFVLLSLFTLLSLMILARYTFPAGGDDLSLSGTLPLVFGGLVIGGVVLYFSFIKSE